MIFFRTFIVWSKINTVYGIDLRPAPLCCYFFFKSVYLYGLLDMAIIVENIYIGIILINVVINWKQRENAD